MARFHLEKGINLDINFFPIHKNVKTTKNIQKKKEARHLPNSDFRFYDQMHSVTFSKTIEIVNSMPYLAAINVSSSSLAAILHSTLCLGSEI